MSTKRPRSYPFDLSKPGNLDRLFAMHRSVFGDAVMLEDGEGGGETPPAEPGKQPDPPADLGDAGKKALDAERASVRAEKKRADALAAKIKEYEDRDKSAEERAAASLADLKRELAEEKVGNLRLRVAAETGVPAKFLVGDDEDALRKHAEAIKEWRGEQPATEKRKAPRPDPSQGGSGGQPLPRGASGKAEAERRAALRAN